MDSHGETQIDHNATSETKLWQIVIMRTIEDWRSGSSRRSREAEKYLFHDNIDFPLVCESAGMNPDRLRSELIKLRYRALQTEGASLAA